MIDILQTDEGDLDLTSGDLQLANEWRATEQHKMDILLFSLGDLTEYPLTGASLVDNLNDSMSDLFLYEIGKQMKRDGMTVRQIAFDQAGLIIEGEYETNNN